MPVQDIRLCVILPAFNEADGIASVVSRVLQQRVEGVTIEVVVVNDGSSDETERIAVESGATVITHPKNHGVGAGFRTGLVYAYSSGADYLIHMDSDGQFYAEEIPLLSEPVLSGRVDLAAGSRFLGDAPANLAWWKAGGLRWVSRIVGILIRRRLTDISCGFRCMNRRVMKSIWPSFDYDYIQETLIQALRSGVRFEEVPISVIYHKSGKGSVMSGRVFRYTSRFFYMTTYALLKSIRR